MLSEPMIIVMNGEPLLNLVISLKSLFWIAILLDARQSINNGSRNDADPGLSNNLQTGLYLNDQQYFAWAFKFSYNINKRLGINLYLGGGF